MLDRPEKWTPWSGARNSQKLAQKCFCLLLAILLDPWNVRPVQWSLVIIFVVLAFPSFSPQLYSLVGVSRRHDLGNRTATLRGKWHSERDSEIFSERVTGDLWEVHFVTSSPMQGVLWEVPLIHCTRPGPFCPVIFGDRESAKICENLQRSALRLGLSP